MNNSERVTIYKINENAMGNRVTKSEELPNFSVNAQRVDGGSCNKDFEQKINLNILQLRCTLADFERSYQFKNLSNLFPKQKFYAYYTKRFYNSGRSYFFK